MRIAILACLLAAGVLAAHAAESENALVGRAHSALQARDWPAAEATFRQLTALAPTNWLYLQGLADAEGMQGKNPEAVAAYEKAIPMALAAKDEKSRAAAGAMLTSQGLLYLRLKKFKEGLAAFRKATDYVQNQGVAWFNVCAAGFNAGDIATARVACDKTIAADPTKADAYFIKGSLMLGDSTIGPNGKIVPPRGTVETLQKYLTLAPNGSHVKDVNGMLSSLK